MNPQNVPNAGKTTVRAYMRVKSFASVDNPTPEQLIEFDKEVCSFLETIDNAKRFLNGRNAYSIGTKSYVLVWYLEAIPDQPISTPFGKDDVKQNEQNNNTPKT